MSSIIYEDHIDKMRNNYVWGTRVEVFALALYFFIPVPVVIERSNREYYWRSMAFHKLHLKI